MKKIFRSVMWFSLILPCVACATPVSVKLKVVDEQQQAVADVNVRMAFLLGKGKNSRSAVTDANGTVEVVDEADFGVSMAARKEGYYTSMIRTGYGDQDITLLLREKKNPIAMYARNLLIQMPKNITDYSLDFFKGDVLAPHGDGADTDAKVISDIDIISSDPRNLEFSQKVRFVFSNEHDGVAVAKVPEFWEASELKSSYKAPEFGYTPVFEIYNNRGLSDGRNHNVGTPLFLRIRTKLDKDGKVESANYCKVLPGISLIGALSDTPGFRMTYYCNPTPNDRNVEFDPRKNLFKNLKNDEIGLILSDRAPCHEEMFTIVIRV